MEINKPGYHDSSNLPKEDENIQAGSEDMVENDSSVVNVQIMDTLDQSLIEPGCDNKSVESTELPEAFQEAVSEKKFELAVRAAKELDPELQLPEDLKDQIFAELSKLSPERVAEICSEMHQPTLIIVPANSFEEKIVQIDRNRHYGGQNHTYVIKYDVEPYRNVSSVEKVRVCLVEGKPNISKPNTPIDFGLVREFVAQKTRAKNLDYVGPHREAVILHKSLIEAEETGDKSKIVDLDSMTVLNPRNLADSKYVAIARFNSNNRRVSFYSYALDDENFHIHGRASWQVLEF